MNKEDNQLQKHDLNMARAKTGVSANLTTLVLLVKAHPQYFPVAISNILSRRTTLEKKVMTKTMVLKVLRLMT
jgi:hypothetical protein